MSIMKKVKGFTLSELLCTLSIISILSATALPAFTTLIKILRSDTVYRQLFAVIQFTRAQAAVLSNNVILCPSKDGIKCGKDWQSPIIVFIDDNDDKTKDPEEELLRQFTLLKTGEKIHWRNFGNRRYIRYIADGSTEFQSGNLAICFDQTIPNLTKKIIIFKSGRARKARQEEIEDSDCN